MLTERPLSDPPRNAPGRPLVRVKEVPIRWVNAPNSKVRATTYFEVLGEVWRVRKNLRAGKYDKPQD